MLLSLINCFLYFAFMFLVFIYFIFVTICCLLIIIFALFCCRLEHGVNNIEKVRDSTSKRYRDFKIPWEWMLDTGIVSQVCICFLTISDCTSRVTCENQYRILDY